MFCLNDRGEGDDLIIFLKLARTHELLDPLSIGVTTETMDVEVFLLSRGEILIAFIRDIQMNT